MIRQFDGHTETIRGVEWNPDHTRIVSAAHDRTAREWDVRTGRCLRVLEGHRSMLVNAAYRSDGRIVSCDDSAEVRIWD